MSGSASRHAPGAHRACTSRVCALKLRLEHNPSRDPPSLDVRDRLVDVEPAGASLRSPAPDRGLRSSNTSRRSLRVPTIEPTTVMPFSTVSKIGSRTSLSAGNATNTSVPPRRSELQFCSNEARRNRQSDRLVGAPKSIWIASHGIVSSLALTVNFGAPSSRASASLSSSRVDRDDAPAGDPRVLDRQVPEPADAEHGDEIRRAGAGHLDRLVGRHARAGERGRVNGIDPIGDRDNEVAVCGGELPEAAIDGVAGGSSAPNTASPSLDTQ